MMSEIELPGAKADWNSPQLTETYHKWPPKDYPGRCKPWNRLLGSKTVTLKRFCQHDSCLGGDRLLVFPTPPCSHSLCE
jgi:hypothetical protein